MTLSRHVPAPILTTKWSPPCCAKCGAMMLFSCVEQIDTETVACTYECRCGDTQTDVVPSASIYD